MSSTEKSRRGRWRRVGKWLLILAVVLALVIPLTVAFGLRIGAVRQALIARVAAAVEERTGIRLQVDDFRLRAVAGVVEIDGLALSVPDTDPAAPFLVVPRARATVRWRTLLGDVPVIDSLRIEKPRLDLGAPLPTTRDDTGRSEPGDAGDVLAAFELRELLLIDGEVLGSPPPPSMEILLDGWHADAIRVRGGIGSGRIRIDELSSRATLVSRRRPPVELQARLVASGDTVAGSLDVETLELRGPGLTLDGRGKVDLPSGETRVELTVDAEPASLFPDLTPGGRLRADGEVEIALRPDPTLTGVLRIDATRIPGELAQPWVGVDGGGFLDVAGTHLDAVFDLDARVALTGEAAAHREDTLRGSAELSWSRGEERLATASVRSLDGNGGVHLSVDAQLAPAAAGRRHVTGELHAANLPELLDGSLRAVRVDVVEPDAAGAAVRFGLDPRAVPDWWPRGSVTATLEADGPLRAPRLRLDARWSGEDGEALATVAARTIEDPSPRLRYDLSLLPAWPGRRTLSGELIAPDWTRMPQAEIRQGRLQVELDDVGLAVDELERRLPGLLPPELDDVGVADRLRGGALSILAELSGPLLTPDVDLEAEWTPGADEAVRFVARGRPALVYPFLAPGSNARLVASGLDLTRFDPTEPASLAGRLDASAWIESSDRGLVASLEVRGRELSYGELVTAERLELEASSDGKSVELHRLTGTFEAGAPALPVKGSLSATGVADLAWPPKHAEGQVSITGPVRGVDAIEAFVRLEDGILHVDRIEIVSPQRVATIEGSLPLFAPTAETPGTSMSLAVSDLDLRTVATLLAGDEEPLPLEGLVNASVSFDPSDPLSAVGALEISGIVVSLEDDVSLALGETLRIEIGDGRIVLPPTRLRPTGGLIRGEAPLDLSATVDLSRDWRPGDDPASVVEAINLEVDGTVDAKLLNPFLAGGTANGEVHLLVHAEGSLDTLEADVTVWGPRARVLYVRPYPTRLEDLDAHIVARRGRVELEHARARLNGGQAEMSGTWTADDGLHANLRFDDARYRLQFGITTLLRGNLQLDWPTEGRRRIGGTVVVERAVLRRNIRLTRDVLANLFDVRPETGGAVALDTIDLDLTVLTDQGVLIKNNVADLQADWGRISIGGTAAEPRLEGRVDIHPGGILTAFGQSLRIDEGSFEWFDQPVAEPRVVFETTSSLEDPSIRKSWRNEFYSPVDQGPGRGGTLDFWGQGQAQGQQAGGWEQFATGAMTQATSASRTQLSFEPLPLFGETDTQARYTIASDLAPQLTFIASSNPREAEAQTYIVDVHSIPYLKSFRSQVFTNDQKNAGLTVQQTLKLGKELTRDTEEPFLRSMTIRVPGAIRKRRVREAIGYRKSDPFPTGASLDVEVDVLDLMQRRGFPSADVQVEVQPAEDNRVDLQVTVEPGEAVRYVFEGVRLSSSTRRAIISRYRPHDIGEKASLEEIQGEAVTALQGLGFLEPRVDVEAKPAGMTGPDEPAVVRVTMDGGRQVELERLVFDGLAQDDADYVAGVFGSTLSRVRLAQAAPAYDAILSKALDRRGYPQARIVDRRISDDGEQLVVQVDPGPRRRVASIEIVGLTHDDRRRLAEEIDLHEGDPARQDRIEDAGRVIERDLRDRGHADARVSVEAGPPAEDRPYDVALRYDVDPGPSYRIEQVRFEGLHVSKPKWVEKVAGLESGETYRRRDVAEARARLFRTGVFRRIQTTSEPVPLDSEEREQTVTFEMEEARPWQLAYGGRWEQDVGLSVVADLLNRNSLGIGHLTGFRAIYGAELRNLRVYHVIPRVVGWNSSLEMLVEAKRQPLTENVDVQGVEGWAQLTFQVTERTHNRPYVRFQNPTFIEEAPDPDNPVDTRVISPLLGYQIAYDTTSRRLGEEQRSGIFVGVDLLGSHQRLGSDVTYLGAVSQLKYFWPLGAKDNSRFSWAQFWRGGWIEAQDEPVPFADRFRVGGEFSVRGYPTNSLGPLDENGDALGGEVLFVVNQEIHARLLRTESMGSVAALAFFDAGNVWLNRQSLEGGLFKSVGLGARYVSPVGPLRLDVGLPLDRRPGDPSYKIYFGFGSVF